MKYTSLDTIVKGYLLKKRLPIHFYIECLSQAATCLTELHFDSLRNVRTQELAIGSYNAATLPCDFMDFCKVGIPNGQSVKPITQNNGFSRLNNFDSSGTKVPFTDTSTAIGFGWGNFVWYNDKMEMTGRFYGGTGGTVNGFKILRERNEIQLDNNINADSIILEYISDGSESDNATQVNPYARAAIEAYIEWQYKKNARSHSTGEVDYHRNLYYKEVRILRARLNDITLSDIKNIIRNNTHGSIKG